MSKTPLQRRWVATYSAIPPPLENPATTNPSGRVLNRGHGGAHQLGEAQPLHVPVGFVVVVEGHPVVLVADSYLVPGAAEPLSGVQHTRTDPEAGMEERNIGHTHHRAGSHRHGFPLKDRPTALLSARGASVCADAPWVADTLTP